MKKNIDKVVTYYSIVFTIAMTVLGTVWAIESGDKLPMLVIVSSLVFFLAYFLISLTDKE